MFEVLRRKITKWCLSPETIPIGNVHQSYNPQPCAIYNNDSLKFIEQTTPSDLYVETPTGYSKVKHTHKTVPYKIWKVQSQSNTLLCADEHIVIDENNKEIYVKNLKPNDRIKTKNGIELVLSVEETNKSDNMYDIELDDGNHVYYTDNILSHNSITSSAYILWYTTFKFDKSVLIASNKESSAKGMIKRIRYAYEHLPMWLKQGVVDDGFSKHEIGFENGSSITATATAEDSGRSMSISLLYLDEFAFVAPNIAEEFWSAISPTLSTGGACIITSTPNGDMNIFAQLWRGADLGINGFHPMEVKWNQPPGRDEKFKKNQIGKIGERKWMQEYECVFLSSDALLINSIVLANETERLRNIKPLFTLHDVAFWKQIEEGETYIIGVDPSTGSGEDYSVITGFTFPEMEQVLEFRCNSMSSPYLYNILKNIIKYIEKEGGSVFFSVENNGVGEGIIALYEADENPPSTSEFVSEEGQKRFGFTTTNKTKLRSCVNFKEMFEKINKFPDGGEARAMTINSMTLLKELKSFARKSGSYSAQLGATDDSVSAVLIVLRILEEMATFDQDAHDKLHDYQDDEWGEVSSRGYREDNPDDQPLPIII